MNENIILATIRSSNEKSVDITIKNYNDFLNEQNKDKIAEMIYHRFYDRYIKPFGYKSEEYRSNYKNGFSIMASCSLMIETLECFYQGFETSDRKADIIFKKFFERNKELSEFKDFFYKKIRCGILHQGETYGGYLIKRKGVLFDKKTKTINATKFLNEMKKMLENYKKELKKSEWDSEVWDNFRTKMRHIIKNCD